MNWTQTKLVLPCFISNRTLARGNQKLNLLKLIYVLFYIGRPSVRPLFAVFWGVATSLYLFKRLIFSSQGLIRIPNIMVTVTIAYQRQLLGCCQNLLRLMLLKNHKYHKQVNF